MREASVKFGVFDHLDRTGSSLVEFYEQRLEIVGWYEQAGFHCYHVAEHHGTPLGMAPSPSVYLAAVARHTRRLRFGPLVYLLPLYHPIRLAEEIAMLDALAGGRLQVGVGRGRSPIELAYFGCDPAESQELYDETLAIVLQALGTGRVTFAGKHFSFTDVPLEVRPVQQPHPPLWYGLGSPDGVARCIQQDINAVTLARPEPAAELARSYAAQAAAAGKSDLLFGTCRFVVVAESDERALRIARRAYPIWHSSFFHLFTLHGQRPVQAWPGEWDAMAASGLAFAGSPATVAAALGSELAANEANYSVGQFVFGDMSREESRRSIELFSNEVMPAVTDALAPASTRS
jgi:alkanesulfonate monooxygenase SsuD/methylene tetrahydromethanopterin reductase-like flavin-dependent oxidoreductase (luciferase family)